MKKIIFIFTLLIPSILHSQETFNVILEDTIGHITNSVVENDGFYYVLSGTGSENGVRCFSLTKVNQSGEIQWKNIIDNDTLELWEGWEHNFKSTVNGFFIAGSAININSIEKGFHFSHFDQNLNLSSHNIVMYDTNWKKCFNSLLVEDGSIYVTGQYYDDTLESSYLYLMKFNALREFIWKREYTDSYSSGSQLLECMNGDVICSGQLTPTSYNDWLINRYTTQGDLLWSKRFGWLGSRNDGAVSALAETSDSCILACGSYPGIKTAFDTYYDGCIRKIDENGNLTLERFYRTYTIYTSSGMIMSGMNFSQILTDQQDNYYVIGSTYANNPLWRGFLMKLNKNGEVLFRRLYYSINEESNAIYLNSGSFTTDNGFILLGYGNAYDWFDIYPPQQRWLIKTDSLGMDGLSNTAPDALEVDINLPNEMCAFDTTEQYLYIAGPTAPYTVSISNGQQFDSIYYPPVFVPKEIGPSTIEISYDGISTLEFEEPEVTIANHDWGECIAIPIAFHVGNQVGLVNLDITVTDGWGNSKTITKSIYVTSCPNGINDALINQLQIYPNPASDFLTVELNGNIQTLPISIVDMNGKITIQTQLTEESITIDIRKLHPGNYQLIIEGVSKSFSVIR